MRTYVFIRTVIATTCLTVIGPTYAFSEASPHSARGTAELLAPLPGEAQVVPIDEPRNDGYLFVDLGDSAAQIVASGTVVDRVPLNSDSNCPTGAGTIGEVTVCSKNAVSLKLIGRPQYQCPHTDGKRYGPCQP